MGFIDLRVTSDGLETRYARQKKRAPTFSSDSVAVSWSFIELQALFSAEH